MRHRLFMIWAALRWVLLMFLIAPVMEAPLVAHLSQSIKPIKTWTGNASWYGPGFNGRKTANGEMFSTEALTAAHPNRSEERRVGKECRAGMAQHQYTSKR